MKVVHTQEFRSGFQFINEPVIVEKFGVKQGIYLPLNGGKSDAKVVAPRLFEAAAPRRGRRPVTARSIEVMPKRGPGRPKGSKTRRNLDTVTAQA